MNYGCCTPPLVVTPTSASDPLSLRQGAVSALQWNYLGQAARSASSLAVGIVLARLLGPAPFGEVAIALLIIGLGNQLAEFGLGSALVQRPRLTERDMRFAFWAQLLIGAALALACAILAGPIASVFHQSEVAPVIRALALLFLLQPLGQTAASLLRRNLDFRRLQIAQLLSYLVGYLGVGIPLAGAGCGVWSLVWAQLTQSALNSVIVFGYARHPLAPCLRGEGALLSYGGKVLGTNLVNWTIGNLNLVVAGRWFSPLELGLYSRALVLAGTPVSGGVSAMQSVLFAAYSRAQERTEALPRVYLASLAVIGVVTLPAYAALATVPETALRALFGESWVAAAPLLTAFAVAMPLHAAMGVAGPLLWGVAKVECELRAQFAVALWALVVFAATRFSLVALAWGVVLVYALRFALLTRAALNVLHLRWRDVGRALHGPLALSGVVALVCWWLDRLLQGNGAVLRALAVLLAAAGLQLGALLLAPARLLGEPALEVLDSVRALLPRPVRLLLPAAPARGV